MKSENWKIFLGLFCSCLLYLYLNTSFAMSFDKIIAFGDSLSDNGNIYNLTLEAKKVVMNSPIIPDDPYYSGRFSNGPVWVDNLAKIYNIPLYDYAYGGAWAESFRDSHLLVPFDLRMQVNFYLMRFSIDRSRDKHLYTLWIGANDYIRHRNDQDYATTNTVAKIEYAINTLIHNGAKYIMVLNLPDFSNSPLFKFKNMSSSQELHELIKEHNKKLSIMIAKIKEQFPHIHLMEIDIASYYDHIVESVEKSGVSFAGISNVKDACFNGGYYFGLNVTIDQTIKAAKRSNLDIDSTPDFRIAFLNSRMASNSKLIVCKSPDEYFFWDLVHPTRATHAILTEFILKILNEELAKM